MKRTVSKAEKKKLANLKPFKKGESGNPAGRRKGQRDYVTIYREALIKIAEAKDMTPDEVENLMDEVGITKALKGDFHFYKDIKDRLHGKPNQNTDITSGGKPLIVQFDNAFTSSSKKISE